MAWRYLATCATTRTMTTTVTTTSRPLRTASLFCSGERLPAHISAGCLMYSSSERPPAYLRLWHDMGTFWPSPPPPYLWIPQIYNFSLRVCPVSTHNGALVDGKTNRAPYGGVVSKGLCSRGTLLLQCQWRFKRNVALLWAWLKVVWLARAKIEEEMVRVFIIFYCSFDF
jgi:hypothetical protein